MITQSQKKIIEYPYQPNHILRIDAGPGSGKTFTLLKKIEYLVEQQNVDPQEILVLSLTNKAVENVRANLNEKYRHLCCIKTFHSMANRLIKDVKGFVNVIDDNGWRALHELYGPKKLTSFRSLEKSVVKYRETGHLAHEEVLKILDLMKKCNVYSHYDLIQESIKYIDASVLNKQFKVIIIDEYQDLYPFLIPFIKKFAKNSQLIMFGDMNQSIYQFLGNNERAIESIGYNTVLHLKDNFRSSPEIMEFVNSQDNETSKNQIESGMNGKEKDIVVYSKSESGVPPLNFNNDLIGEISKLICCGVNFKDIAVLTRTNAEVTNIVNKLNLYNIPNEKILKYSKFIVSLIDIMRLSIDLKTGANNEFNRVLVLKKLSDWDLNDLKIARLDQDLRALHDIADPIELVKKLVTISYNLGNVPDSTIYKFTEIMKICSECGTYNMSLVECFFDKALDVTLDSSDENSVKVSTIHASKGLEYPIVFVDKLELAWMGQSSSMQDGKNNGFFTGERNVKYVAYTRPRNLLYLNNFGIKNHNILTNSSFWDYYYKDLRLPNRFNQSFAIKSFQKLGKFLSRA
ncbi:hypothetical protein ACO0RG_000326 [Hanseniaspora osmophila]|uniref:DNA 3'-5' helicase n=1 Tax=Hanseniaspora osmophila TaxID=56408 RepID=A0A1E5R4Z3_9ASCO|nr:ATP-dependent DNA helicase HMI1, mitochondrial [Hanseniaspora osmophila]